MLPSNDGFVPDDTSASGGDGFIADAAPTGNSPGALQTIRNFIAKAGTQKGNTAPGQAFNQDAQGPGIQDATVGDASTLYSIYKSPQAISGLYNLGKSGVSLLGNLLNAGKDAEALAPAESALSAGLNAKDALNTEKTAATATKNALYASIPKDIEAPTPLVQSTADSIINEVKDLQPSIQKGLGKILDITGDLQDTSKDTIGSIQATNSALKDIATNGEGVEKVYAARLSKALMSDLDNFGNGSMNGVAAANSDIPQALKKANSFYKDFADLQNHPVAQSLAKARPEEMADVIFRRGNVDDVNVAKAVLGQQGFSTLQGQFYQNILDSKNIGKTLTKYTPEFLDAAIGDKGVKALQALDQFKTLVSKAVLAGKLGAGAVVGGTAFETGRKFLHTP